jgi:hypothetical protein
MSNTNTTQDQQKQDNPQPQLLQYEINSGTKDDQHPNPRHNAQEHDLGDNDA